MRNQNSSRLQRLCSRLVGVASLWIACVAAQAQVAIEAVTGSVQGGVEVVKIDLSKP